MQYPREKFGLVLVVVFVVARKGKPSGQAPSTDRHRLRASSKVSLPPIQEFDLTVHLSSASAEPVEIPSSADDALVYRVDPIAQSCTCPDWQRRSDRPKDHLGRFCKHMMGVLRDSGAITAESDWVRAIVAQGFGGPTKAWLIELTSAPAVLVISAGASDWVNVLARTTRSGERIIQASGPIQSYGWNVEADRWSYGEGPAGARELTPVMRAIL